MYDYENFSNMIKYRADLYSIPENEEPLLIDSD